MIKINLLPQRKPRRQADPGQQQVALGALGIMALFAGIYFGYHRGIQTKYNQLRQTDSGLEADNAKKRTEVDKGKALQNVVESAEERSKAIAKLVKAKSVPAHLLQELSDILTPGRSPTMTKEMATRTSDGPKGDPNRRFDPLWDPKHVWISSFSEKGGVFTLSGGAQSDADVTQVAKRLQASIYFMEVTPRGGERVTDANGSVSYYQFTITGKVVY
ncbi:MAG: PilN domain-containing protein [Deltaproteobacteria bacterium]|nr:PilN domain-containing protein [Deltaproteobacteria bacterium]